MSATGLVLDKNHKEMPTLPKKGTQAVSFDTSTTTNRSVAVDGNICFVRATVDCWIKRGGAAVTGTTTPGDDVFFVGANDGWWDYNVFASNNQFAVIGDSASGTLYILETDPVRN